MNARIVISLATASVLYAQAPANAFSVKEMHVAGMHSRRADGKYTFDKRAYNNLYIRFSPVSGSDTERTVDTDGKFFVAAGQIGTLTYDCKTFGGAKILYSSTGSFSGSFTCRDKSTVRMRTTLKRDGDRWLFDAQVTGVAANKEKWELTESIEMTVNASGCTLHNYRFTRATSESNPTLTTHDSPTCRFN